MGGRSGALPKAKSNPYAAWLEKTSYEDIVGNIKVTRTKFKLKKLKGKKK